MLIAKRINVDCEEYTVSALLYHNTQNITVVWADLYSDIKSLRAQLSFAVT